MAYERYVGMLPRNAYIIVPLRAYEAYELKIGEVNTGRLDKFVQVYTLEKDELIDLSYRTQLIILATIFLFPP